MMKTQPAPRARAGRKTTCPIAAPRNAWVAYCAHRSAAKQRGIAFWLTFAEWWAWRQTDNRWARRGRGKDHLCMARFHDRGPYSLDNILCVTNRENMKLAAKRQGSKPLAGVRGSAHPRSRQVRTPAGTFGSAALAAESFGITRQHAARMARAGVDGWRYA